MKNLVKNSKKINENITLLISKILFMKYTKIIEK